MAGDRRNQFGSWGNRIHAMYMLYKSVELIIEIVPIILSNQ